MTPHSASVRPEVGKGQLCILHYDPTTPTITIISFSSFSSSFLFVLISLAVMAYMHLLHQRHCIITPLFQYFGGVLVFHPVGPYLLIAVSNNPHVNCCLQVIAIRHV